MSVPLEEEVVAVAAAAFQFRSARNILVRLRGFIWGMGIHILSALGAGIVICCEPYRR